MTSEFYEDEKMRPEEENFGSREAFSKLLPFLGKHKKGFIFCLGLVVSATLFSLIWPVLLKRAVDVNIANDDFKGLILTVVGIAAVQGLTLILQYIYTVKIEGIGQDIMVELKNKLFNHILALNVSFFDKNPVGRLMARVESDTESLRMLFTRTVVMILADFILMLGIFGVMLYHSWRLTLILSLIAPIIVSLIYIFQKHTNERFLNVRKQMAEITASLTEYLQGMSVIQIFGRHKHFRKKLNLVNRKKFKSESYVVIAVSVFFNAVYFFENVLFAMILFFGVLFIQSGHLTVGAISMFVVLVWRAYEPLHRSSEQLANIQKGIAGAKRLFALLSNRDTLPQSENPVTWKGLNAAIRFENVWFSYGGDDNWVLRDVSFEVPRGNQVALAGVTGGGKTTIISLLLRLYDPQKGRITVDGIDIRDIPIAELRKKFALVLQDIYLFPEDIRSNIALDTEEMTESKVITAAKTVDAHGFIQRLPNKYDTEVSEKGSNFSRGERQLLSFARALAADPDVLVLDEATSSVDPHTEETIQKSMRKLMRGRTSLVIAHRLMTILEADEILVIKRGEIVERGNHVDLILQNGYYSKLFHLQFKNGVTANA